MVMVASGGNGTGNFERPGPGLHLATWAQTYEVGTHEREWKGVKKKAAMLCIVWELEKQDSKGKRFTMFDVVPASTFGKSKMREALESAIRRPLTDAEVDKGFDTAKAHGKCVMLVVVPGKSDPSKSYINRRDIVQDEKRTLTPKGKYGPADPIPGYVWAVMKSADAGTVRAGQGTEPVKRDPNAKDEPTEQPEPADVNGAPDGDIPF